MAKRKDVTEEMLLKALGDLESNLDADDEVEAPVTKSAAAEDESSEDESSEEEEAPAKKSHTASAPGMPDDTDESNGGLSQHDSDDAENFETDANEVDPTKSMKSMVSGSKELRKGFEVSSFLETLVDTNVEAVDGLAKSQAEAFAEQRAFNAKVQKALVAIGNAVMGLKKSQADSEEEPVQARPRSVIHKSEVAERFGGGESQAPSYSREQTLNAITDMAMKGEIDAIAVSAYESSGFVDSAFHDKVNAKLKSMFR